MRRFTLKFKREDYRIDMRDVIAQLFSYQASDCVTFEIIKTSDDTLIVDLDTEVDYLELYNRSSFEII